MKAEGGATFTHLSTFTKLIVTSVPLRGCLPSLPPLYFSGMDKLEAGSGAKVAVTLEKTQPTQRREISTGL